MPHSEYVACRKISAQAYEGVGRKQGAMQDDVPAERTLREGPRLFPLEYPAHKHLKGIMCWQLSDCTCVVFRASSTKANEGMGHRKGGHAG